jgi:hypothetical protein
MIQRISHERCSPKEGGFEARPYDPPDFVRGLAKGARGLPQWVKCKELIASKYRPLNLNNRTFRTLAGPRRIQPNQTFGR